MSHPFCITYGCTYELDLDGRVSCVICGTINNEVDISGSYNGSTPGSEPVNEGPNPSPEAGYNTGKWSEDDDMGITPFLGPNR